MTRVTLRGIGTAVPPVRIDDAESLRAARVLCAEDEDHAEVLGTLYRQAGIEARHIVYRPDEVERIIHGRGESDSPFVPRYPGDPGPSTGVRMQRFEREALPLAIAAARAALADAHTAPGEITHLVTVTCTGFSAPGVDIGLIRELGLRPTTERAQIGFMGCHGSINALRVARGLVSAEPEARVLLVSIELCSLHYHYGWNPKKMVGNALFADGAGAVVVARGEHGDENPWSIAAGGSCIFPGSEAAMAWEVRDHGFDMTLSAKVPNLIRQNLRGWLGGWLESRGLSIEAIPSWAVHPGGPRVLTSVAEALGLAEERLDVSREVLRTHGNMSSATVLFIVERLRRSGAPLPCLALGFGPGLAAEAVLFA